MSNHFYKESLRAKLNELQERLVKEKGMTGFGGLYLHPNKEHTFEAVAEDLIHIVEAFLNNEMKELPPIGDSVRPHDFSAHDEFDSFTPHP